MSSRAYTRSPLEAEAHSLCGQTMLAFWSDVPAEREGAAMTGKAVFTDEEWTTVLQGPPSAGVIVVTAQRGGSFRETIAMAKSYSEARKQHGESELLDEITSTKPQTDHTRYHSEQELKEGGLQHIRAAIQVLDAKATPEEVEDYKQFVLHLADNVASAHREGGIAESPAEKAAIDEIATAMGTAAS
jgi:hypothetical protein